MLKPELTGIAQQILKNKYRSDEAVNTISPLKGGEWSAAYRYSYDGNSFVIRLSHTPENFYRDNIAARLASPNLPIPQIYMIDRHEDYYYAISTFYPGEALEGLPAADLEKTVPEFLSMMTALRSIDLGSTTGYGSLTSAGQGAYQSWHEFLLDIINDRPDSLTYGWSKALSEIPRAQGRFEQIFRRLTKLVQFCPEQKHLIHSDLIYQNLLVYNHRISAVLDWGCAMISDPVYDIACFALYEPWFPAFSQVNLIQKMKQSYLNQSPENQENFAQRILAYQTHLALGNIAYCAFSKRNKDFHDNINRSVFVR